MELDFILFTGQVQRLSVVQTEPTYKLEHITMQCAPFFVDIECAEEYEAKQEAGKYEKAHSPHLVKSALPDTTWYDQFAWEHPEVENETKALAIGVEKDQNIMATVPTSSVTGAADSSNSESNTPQLGESPPRMGIHSETLSPQGLRELCHHS